MIKARYFLPKGYLYFARINKESFVKLFLKLKKLVKRSWSIDLDYRIKKINEVLRGWINYYRQSSMKEKLGKIGKWLRNAIRVIIWKQWKTISKRRISLLKLGVSKRESEILSNTRKGYQTISHCPIITKAITNSRLKKRGLLDPLEYYLNR